MGRTFAEKFEEALARKRDQVPDYGLRTLARDLAAGDRDRVESIRRRLNKYRTPKGGGAAETQPTAPTRWEIEDALGLDRDTLAPDPAADIAARQVMVTIDLDYDLLAEAITRREANAAESVEAQSEARQVAS